MSLLSGFGRVAALGLRAVLLGVCAFSTFPTLVQAQTSGSAYTTGYRWDAMRRLVGTISPDPDGAGALSFPAARYTYDLDGQLIKTEKGVLAAWQAETVTPASWSGFTVQETQLISYDTVGNLVEQRTLGSDGNVQAVSQTSYDADDRATCVAVRMNLAAIPAAGSDACALGTAGADGADRITKSIYDAAGQILQIRKAVGTSLEQAYATNTYSLNGKQTALIDANGNKATMVYDGFDRQTQWFFPSATLPASFNPATPATAVATAGAASATDYEQYSYDANGNRLTLKKRDGRTINYSYDALNRVTLKDIPSATTLDVYTDYDLRGLQLYARFGSTSGEGVTNTYDKAGRLLTSTTTQGGTSRQLSYQYDANGNRTQLTFPDSTSFTYAYDGLNRMTGIAETSGNITRATIAYDAFGRRGSAGRTGLDGATYTYDPASRLQTLGNSFVGGSTNVTHSFTYTPASQIRTRDISSDAYAYMGDVNVNRTYAKNGLNQYTTAGPATFGYDVNGNLTGDGSTTYVYDVENRLTSATGATTATLVWDPMGRLYSTNGGGAGETRFLYDGDALVGEYSNTGTLLRRYVHGPGVDEPLVWYEGATLATPRYYHANQQGSIIAIADATGALQTIKTYDAYGIPGATSASIGRFSYTGQIYIPELAMYHYKARIYSPTLGRFLQTDPIGYKDQNNLYAYVGNDPGNATDPTGTYGRGDGFTDSQWKKFDKVQQDAAKAMEKRADKLDAKADKRDAKGKAGGDQLRDRATALRAGAGFLKSDGSDGAKANMASASNWTGNPLAAARVDKIGGNQMFVNGGHAAWSAAGAAGSVTFIVGHESLHSAGYRHAIGPNGAISYRYSDDPAQTRAYRSITGTPAANSDPDHLMSEVYP